MYCSPRTRNFPIASNKSVRWIVALTVWNETRFRVKALGLSWMSQEKGPVAENVSIVTPQEEAKMLRVSRGLQLL